MNYMPGTVAPEDVAKQQQMQMLVDALRNPQQPLVQSQGASPVQSAGYIGQGMNTNAIGGALGSAFKGGIGGMSGGFGATPQAMDTAALIRGS